MDTFPPTFSGATKFWLRLVPKLGEHGVVVDFLYRKDDGEVILQKADGSSLSITEPLGTRRGSHTGYILTVVKALWIHRHQYRCVIFIGAGDALFAALCTKMFMPLKFAYRMSMLGEDDPLAIRNTGRLGWLRAFLLRRIDAAVCINPGMAVSSERMGLAQDRVFTIPQGTDIDFFTPATLAVKNAMRIKESLPLTAKIVIFCGAIVERKGVDLLMKAWPEVVAQHPASLLLLVGPNGGELDDPGSEFLQAMKRFSLDRAYKQSVRFLGYREDARDLLHTADMFVLPSRMEGTPNVLLEAMASGLPIVVSDLPGVAGVFIRDRKEAFIVPLNDWKQIEVSLLHFLDDQDLARQFGECARERVVTNYSLTSVGRKYVEMFKTLE